MIYNSKRFSNGRMSYNYENLQARLKQLGCAISSPSLTTLRLLFSGADQGIDERGGNSMIVHNYGACPRKILVFSCSERASSAI